MKKIALTAIPLLLVLGWLIRKDIEATGGSIVPQGNQKYEITAMEDCDIFRAAEALCDSESQGKFGFAQGIQDLGKDKVKAVIVCSSEMASRPPFKCDISMRKLRWRPAYRPELGKKFFELSL